jgi:hypothetical protein
VLLRRRCFVPRVGPEIQVPDSVKRKPTSAGASKTTPNTDFRRAA